MGGILYNDKENFEYNELYDQGITEVLEDGEKEKEKVN